MNLVKRKFIQMLSNGSLSISSESCYTTEQFHINEKDYKVYFLFKKKKNKNLKKFNSSSKYKNQYLF